MSDKPKSPGKPEDFKTRANDFIDSVVDALRNPDPEYLARRAKFVEQKEREDAEILAKYHREVEASLAAKRAGSAASAPAAEERPVRLAGTPRSLFELDFVVGMQPCSRCGAFSELAWKKVESNRNWFVSATCDKCKHTRSYVATATEDLMEVEVPSLELGGMLPSTMFDAQELIAEIERVGARVSKVPDLPEPERTQNWDRIVRIETALNELAKFASPGPAAVSNKAVDLMRTWIAAERAHGEQTSAALAPPELEKTPILVDQRGELSREAFKLHLAWVNAGKQGPGRLEVRGANGRNMRLVGTLIVSGKLESVDFTGADLSRSFWNECEFTRCTFHKTFVLETVLEGTTLIDCRFDDAVGSQVNLKGVSLSGCTFDRAKLTSIRMRGTVSAHSSFVGAQLRNSKLQETKFFDCDFRDAALGRGEPMPSPSIEGALFERCDFRGADFQGADLSGAVFRSCKFGGAYGVPDASKGARVIDADLSLNGDGSATGDLDALLQHLTAS